MPKSRTDLYFEKYLIQRGVRNFEYEPYRDGGKNPDFRFAIKGNIILAEIEELSITPNDKLSARLSEVPPGMIISDARDPRDFLNKIRSKIDAASVQLKPRISDADNCIVIIGKSQEGWDNEINHWYLFHAMYGDLAYRRVYSKSGEPKLEPFGVGNGALRKYNSKTKTWVVQHNYISAVGTVQKFSPYQEYEKKFADKFFSKFDILNHKNIAIFQKAWRVHKSKLPLYARDPNKTLFRLSLIANRNSTKPLLKEVFNYKYDNYTYFSNI